MDGRNETPKLKVCWKFRGHRRCLGRAKLGKYTYLPIYQEKTVACPGATFDLACDVRVVMVASMLLFHASVWSVEEFALCCSNQHRTVNNTTCSTPPRSLRVPPSTTYIIHVDRTTSSRAVHRFVMKSYKSRRCSQVAFSCAYYSFHMLKQPSDIQQVHIHTS